MKTILEVLEDRLLKYVPMEELKETAVAIEAALKVDVAEDKREKKKAIEDEWLEMFNRIKANFHAKKGSRFVRTRQISKVARLHDRLKIYSMEELGKVIYNAYNDQHHIESGWKWVTTDFVLRNDIIERYLNK